MISDPPRADARADMAEGYPNGWFVVAFSGDVRPGRVSTHRLAGEDIVLYRTESGQLRAVGPHCPHLGAHLGHGGRVQGEDLVCPFHAFAFGPDGRCVRNAYGTAPPRANLARVPVTEADGMIFAWRHAGGDAPTWDVPVFDPTGAASRSQWAKTMGGHPLDICENSIDLGHFVPVHGGQNVTMLSPPVADGPHLHARIAFAGFYFLSGLHAEFDLHMYGVGYLAAEVTFPRLRLTVRELVCWTPVDPGRQRLHKTTYARFHGAKRVPPRLNRLVSAVAAPLAGLGSVLQIRDDQPIWANRRYVAHPRLAQGDGPVMQYRRWAEQFFPPVRPWASTPVTDFAASQAAPARQAAATSEAATTSEAAAVAERVAS
ncbi:Rieske (2Fe-2S) protein [Frankia sp. AiPs1]|uniref:aromatic ring-hydroxylating oxygenase subunit alpha n=1 Tax=Frankia sp. AiPs1 TaxID=573493 RepID=UPI002043CE60|nr:Rieske 2Fe-2S domain-containing protein [Frankia sp. AiPs1]MCM3923602.1 Rieske (2Fe-2S) protein [Frankia sp. AiPs1]